MDDYKEPRTIRESARAHLDANPLPSQDYRWVLGIPTETRKGWLYEYEYEAIDDRPEDEWEVFGGAAGFVVSSSGTISPVSWQALSQLLEQSR